MSVACRVVELRGHPYLTLRTSYAADEQGIHGLWVGEHVVMFDDYDSSYPYAADGRMPAPPGSGLLDPFVALGFLACCTSRVRLGTAMALLPQRNPVYAENKRGRIGPVAYGTICAVLRGLVQQGFAQVRGNTRKQYRGVS